MAYWALEALDGSKTALSSLDRVEGTDPPAYKLGRRLPTYCGALWGGQNRTYLPIAWGLTRAQTPYLARSRNPVVTTATSGRELSWNV